MFGTFDFLWSSVSVLLFYTLLQLVLMLRDETICLMLFSCIRIRPHVMLFWCVRMRPHVSGGSDASGWDHMSHVVLMHQDETTCLMLFWCVRMRPHVSGGSDALGWGHVSGGSDAPGWDHMSQVVLMHRDEATCLMLSWCVRMRPRLTSQPLPLSCYCAHHCQLSLSWCEPDYCCTVCSETLLQWFSVLCASKMYFFIQIIHPCFLCPF